MRGAVGVEVAVREGAVVVRARVRENSPANRADDPPTPQCISRDARRVHAISLLRLVCGTRRGTCRGLKIRRRFRVGQCV